MIAFYQLELSAQLGIASLFFFAALTTLALCFYRYICTGSLKKCLFDALLFSGELVFLSLLTFNKSSAGNELIIYTLPVCVFVVTALMIMLYFAVSVLLLNRKSDSTLSPFSVKDALDNLNSGVCFFDSNGITVLINHKMSAIFEAVTGAYPQTFDELSNAFESKSERVKGEGIDDSLRMYRLPDGRIYRLLITGIDSGELENYVQLAAFDVTELFLANKKLIEENEEIRRTNEKLQAMYERIADRIREEETLKLRIRVHDDIGASLIAISDLMSAESDRDMQTQLEILQNAVSYFESSVSYEYKTLEDLRQRAARMHVAVEVCGELPKDGEQYSLIVLAAGECITNCVRHAGGDKVFITSEHLDGKYRVSYTNNGRMPAGPITEGVGLSSLRKSVEAASSQMTVLYEPEFKLILTLPEKEKK